MNDPDLRQVHAHLSQGTRLSKKLTNIKDINRYLNYTIIARDGLLVVCEQLAAASEGIVVPGQIANDVKINISLRNVKINIYLRKQVET